MKKIAYLCGMMLLSLNIMAQIGDTENWQVLFDEGFGGNRWWNTSSFLEQSSDPSFQQRWDCMTAEWWPYYITTNEHSHQAYQPSHARFGSDQKMRLVAECISPLSPLVCANGDYLLPQNAHCSLVYNGCYYPPHPSIFYYSGTVETHWVEAPDGLQTYLPLAGDYLITFTLANGDEYYGEFTVTN